MRIVQQSNDNLFVCVHTLRSGQCDERHHLSHSSHNVTNTLVNTDVGGANGFTITPPSPSSSYAAVSTDDKTSSVKGAGGCIHTCWTGGHYKSC